MFELTKLSAPGWEKQFQTSLEVYMELQHYICNMCIEEFNDQFHTNPDDMHDLLWTACGAEFMVEYFPAGKDNHAVDIS